jgi:hypothetical protein
LREHATAKESSNLVGIALVIFGLAAVDGLHREGMPEDKGNALRGAEVSEPVPGEDAFHGHNQTVPIGRNSLEKWFRSGFHIAVEHDVPVVAHDTDVQAARVQINTTVQWVLIGVESHEVSPL